MFDPTIFENLKVVMEGAIYDLDLAKEICVTDRRDIVDLATLSRTFSMNFQLVDGTTIGEIILVASIKDFINEKIQNEANAGSELFVNFYTQINNEDNCNLIEQTLNGIWNQRPLITQELSYTYRKKTDLKVIIKLNFHRKINENQIDDISSIINLMKKSLQFLEKIH